MEPQDIVIFEQEGSADYKIAGIEVYGKDIKIKKVFNISGNLPELIDYPEEYISDNFSADLVLNFIKHPDLSEYLVKICKKKGIPVIASGQHIPGAITPFTCCGLGKRKDCGNYGSQFGTPEYDIEIKDGKIEKIIVTRGASCGATWQVIPRLLGCEPDEALEKIGREAQYLCMANPSAFDPVSGKSMVHFAGEVHYHALKKALKKAKGKNSGAH
jgi:hypothetical protein